MQEAIDAERAGFGTVWFSERYGLKDTGAIPGTVAALTQRIRFASGVIACGFAASAADSDVGVDHAGPVRRPGHCRIGPR